MARNLDTKILTGFTREVDSYLPQIRASIASLSTEAPQREALDEAWRYVHTIKGAAAMLGLAALSHMTAGIEETLHALVAGQRQPDAACHAWLSVAVEHVEGYLHSLVAGDGRDQGIVLDAVQAWQRFQGLPDDAVAAVVPAILTEEAAPLPQPEPGDGTSARAGQPQPSAGTAPETTLHALVSTIDAEVRHVYGQGAAAPGPVAGSDSPDQTQRYVLFTLAASRYAVSAAHVLEIGRVPPITPVPHVPSWVRGVANLRGDILSVIDAGTLLGGAQAHQGEQNRILVVKTTGDEIVTALVVDHVLGIVPLTTTLLEPSASPVPAHVAPYINGVYRHAEQALAVLDLQRFLLSPAIRQFE